MTSSSGGYSSVRARASGSGRRGAKIHTSCAVVAAPTGLAATVTWYLENRPWCDDVATRYRRERLGAGAAAAQAQQSANR